MKKPTETDLVKAVIEYMNATGRYIVWRNNTGAFAGDYNGKRRFVRFGVPGAADVFGIQKRSGRFVAVECKMPNAGTSKKRLQQQLEFLASIRNAGGIGIMATSLEQLIGELGNA